MKQREIKFKAKNKTTNEWVYSMTIAKGTIKRKKDLYFMEIGESDKWVGINPETLCQYSGMKDKNGVEIYEGDYDQDGNILIFCEECYGWQFGCADIPSKEVVFCNNCEGNFMLLDHLKDFEIIGNIHD